jgi:hypothetical protein
MATFTLSQLDALPSGYSILDTDLILLTIGTNTPFLSSVKISTQQFGTYVAGGGWTDDGTVVRLNTITDKVGIGTTTPSETLTVAGNVSARGSVYDTHTANVKEFGAVGDEVTDDGAAIQLALDSGRRNVYIPAGTYKTTQQLVVPDNVNIFGDGTAITILSCVAPSDIIYAMALQGTGPTPGSALPTLANSVSAGQTWLDFSSNPGLSEGQLITISNPTDYSFNLKSAHHRAGEFVECLSAVGNKVYLTGPTYDAYTKTDVGLSAVATTTHIVRDFSIKGHRSSAKGGMLVEWNRDTVIENINIDNAQAWDLAIEACYQCRIQGGEYMMKAPGTGEAYPGNQYGILVSNCQHLTIDGVLASSQRHAIAMGGSTLGAPPCRDVHVTGSHLQCSSGALAADMHGNVEFSSYRDCQIDGGIAIGGDNNVIDSNIIRSAPDGLAVYGGGFRSPNLQITDNHIIKLGTSTQSSPDLWLGGFAIYNGAFISLTYEAHTTKPGTVVIEGNYMDWDLSDFGAVNLSPIFINRSNCNVQETRISIKNNHMQTLASITSGANYIPIGNGATYPYWERVVISDNTCHGMGWDIRGATNLTFNNNVMRYGWTGLFASNLTENVQLHNNIITGMRGYGMQIQGKTPVPFTCKMSVIGNYVVGNLAHAGQPHSADSYSQTGIALTNGLSADVLSNVCGNPDSAWQTYPMTFHSLSSLQRGTNVVKGTGSVAVHATVQDDRGISKLV